ncbi:hypothetical protein [Roseospira visakhapatnamensis]|uniref:Bbp19-like phage domain-containing protein n=1 Tax=Roseospira visakhapatnamensis TaxID=390880 RepID=A0A7W6RCR3_9PROT|nr:hypothetical protein [Roseospira visakhapatnamensis]MBB4266110.1 hypothetical protein [Roseospira visakhapatnamensis]
MVADDPASWPWGPGPLPASPGSPETEAHAGLARVAARVFRGDDGARVLAHLRALTTHRHLGPEASDAALRFLEGQRALVAHLERLIAEGRAGG